MKNLTVSLNETENKLFQSKAEKRNLTPYALHKRIMRDFLETDADKDLIIVQDNKATLIAYFMLLYSLVVTALLVF